MSKVLIIAEAGVNHNGEVGLAMKLIEAAKAAGADYVKFQTFKAEKLVSKIAQKANYQIINTGGKEEADTSQLTMLKKLELDIDAHIYLYKYCKESGIRFLSSPFDLESIDFLARLGLETFKIPSGEITNLPYLEKIGKLGRKVILSTGMANLEETEAALDMLVRSGTPKQNICVLHCNTEYPTPMEDVNLKAMLTLATTFGIAVGYSDHTLGIEVPIAAVALGAQVIEKHFTLDRSLPGPDHQASLEPGELKQMIVAIRNLEEAMGDGQKRPSPSEMKNIQAVRKSIVAARPIRKGEVFTAENLTVKRPGTGISPMKWYEVLGKQAQKDYQEDELI